MYCKKCGFITRGHEKSCPYCGEIYEPKGKYDKPITFLNWFEISPRVLVELILTNIYIILVIADIILIYGLDNSINVHLSFYGFIAIYGLIFIFHDFLFPKDRRRNFYFLKTYSFVVLAGIIMMLSFPSWNNDLLPLINISSFNFCFGYLYPSLIIFLVLTGTCHFFIHKFFNIFSTVFYVLILIFSGLTLFIMAFFPSLGFNTINRILIYISFGTAIFTMINLAIVFSLKLRTRGVSE